jgi:hypothetical protein
VKPARALPIVRDTRWTCPCGCDLALSTTDTTTEMRLLANLGAFVDVPRPHLSTVPMSVTTREKPEPMSETRCSACGRVLSMATYLIDFIASHLAAPLRCEGCRA